MGKQPFFDDAALQAAATQTAESLLSSLPAPSACQHVFSELFLEKMRRLRRRYSWRKAGRTAGRYAAAILLTASLTLGAIMAVSPQARAGIMQWVREKQENRIIYRFYKEQTQAPLPLYRPTWIPEGMEQEKYRYDKFSYFAFYYNNETEQGFSIDYSYMDDSSIPVVTPEEGCTIIIARNMEVPPELLELAEKHGRTLLRTERKTVDATSEIIDYLNKKLAPQITRHGVLMNINGQGVLILGESGIGKSETAIELLKRGHRLVADDAVEIRRISTSLYGTAPELIRHYIEIRGVGVIDVQQLFGMGAVQFDTEIDLVVQLEQWKDGKFYDRLGLGEETYEILGVKLPYMIVPVRPGRNLDGIVEIATMKNRQMKYGYNPARDFVTRLDQHYDALNEANRRKNQ